MPAGFVINEWKGRGGRIVVPGLGAVLAELDTWTLTRREDAALDDPRWDLHGVFSYVNPVLLKQEGLSWRMEITAAKTTYTVTVDRTNFKVEGNYFDTKGAVLNVRD